MLETLALLEALHHSRELGVNKGQEVALSDSTAAGQEYVFAAKKKVEYTALLLGEHGYPSYNEKIGSNFSNNLAKR